MSVSAAADIRELLANNRFLRLTNSREVLPDSGGEGLSLLQLATDQCQALIALQGGQLLTFQPLGKPDLLWLSPRCQFTPGKALRGGIPVCLPWFGPHPSDKSKPQHGFARVSDWTLTDAAMLDDGRCRIELVLQSEDQPLFAHPFTARLQLLLGREVQLTLSITNRGQETMPCSWALHSYFSVTNSAAVRVSGLKHKVYLDNLNNLQRTTQNTDLTFDSETDRLFTQVHSPIVIESDPRIFITHQNCPSVICWNPGAQKAAAIEDIGVNNERHFICVERGAVKDDAWLILPNECKSGKVTIAAVD